MAGAGQAGGQAGVQDRAPVIDWIAAEFGPGWLRAWVLSDDGGILAQARGDWPGKAHADPIPALLALVGDWPGKDGEAASGGNGRSGGNVPHKDRRAVPVLASGLSGGAGLRPVPCPALAGPLQPGDSADPRLALWLVPGLVQQAPSVDVMQGAETRIAGVLAARPGWDGVVCLTGPQTHWAELSAAEVVGFRSFMTAELFGLIRPLVSGHAPKTPAAAPDDGFDDAVAQGMARPQALAARLSSLRAEGLVKGPSGSSDARLWGLLIGAELAAARGWWLGRDVVIVGEDALPGLYARALAAQGVGATRIDAGTATLAGLAQARRLLRDQPADGAISSTRGK